MELARQTAKLLAQGALNGAEALEIARKAKPTRHYVAETIMIAVVLAAIGLLMYWKPSLTPFLVPVEIVVVSLVVRFYSKFDEWFSSLHRRPNRKSK